MSHTLFNQSTKNTNPGIILADRLFYFLYYKKSRTSHVVTCLKSYFMVMVSTCLEDIRLVKLKCQDNSCFINLFMYFSTLVQKFYPALCLIKVTSRREFDLSDQNLTCLFKTEIGWVVK